MLRKFYIVVCTQGAVMWCSRSFTDWVLSRKKLFWTWECRKGEQKRMPSSPANMRKIRAAGNNAEHMGIVHYLASSSVNKRARFCSSQLRSGCSLCVRLCLWEKMAGEMRKLTKEGQGGPKPPKESRSSGFGITFCVQRTRAGSVLVS